MNLSCVTMQPAPLLAVLMLMSACGAASSDSASTATLDKTRVPPATGVEPIPARPEAEPRPKKERAMIDLGPLIRGESGLPEALRGSWVLIRQTVTGSGVQAYGDDDPELLGAELSLEPRKLAWTSPRQSLSGTCDEAFYDIEETGETLRAAREEIAPALRRLGRSVNGSRVVRFLCMGDDSMTLLEPGMVTLIVLQDGALVLRSTDNLLLVLERR